MYKDCSECQKQFLYTTCSTSTHVLQKEEFLRYIYLYISTVICLRGIPNNATYESIYSFLFSFLD